jgi:hypothetical protein
LARGAASREGPAGKRCAFVQLHQWHAERGGEVICSHLPNYCAPHKSWANRKFAMRRQVPAGVVSFFNTL